MENEIRPFVERMLKREIAFLRRVCDLDATQREAVKKAGQAFLPEIITRYALDEARMRQGNGDVGVPARYEPGAVPAAGRECQKTLRPAQAERYRRELELRTASRKRAVVDYMVAGADKTLGCRRIEREKLAAALTKHYSDEWQKALPILMNNSQYAPSIPDTDILPLLPRIRGRFGRGFPSWGDFRTSRPWRTFQGMGLFPDGSCEPE